MKTTNLTGKYFVKIAILSLCMFFSASATNAQILNEDDKYWKSVRDALEKEKKDAQTAYVKLQSMGFIDFLKEFTKDIETQVSLINKPYIVESTDFDSDDYQVKTEKIYNISAENRSLIEYDDFLFGDRNEITECNFSGYWEIEVNTVTYTAKGYANGCLYSYIFKKINNKWMLHSFVDNSM